MTHEDDYLGAAKFTLEASHREARRETKAKGAVGGDSISTTDQLINVGRLEALIAIAERRQPQVVQVGAYTIRADAIATVYEHGDGNTISVYSTTGASLAMLEGKELAAFLNWWNGYADVVRLPQAMLAGEQENAR